MRGPAPRRWIETFVCSPPPGCGGLCPVDALNRAVGSGTFQLVQQRRQLVGEHVVVVPVATSERASLEPMAQLLDGRFLGFPLTLQPVARAMVAVDFVQLA